MNAVSVDLKSSSKPSRTKKCQLGDRQRSLRNWAGSYSRIARAIFGSKRQP